MASIIHLVQIFFTALKNDCWNIHIIPIAWTKWMLNLMDSVGPCVSFAKNAKKVCFICFVPCKNKVNRDMIFKQKLFSFSDLPIAMSKGSKGEDKRTAIECLCSF